MEWLLAIVVALIGAGALRYAERAWDKLRARRAASSPAGVESARLAVADQSLAVVAHARDELAEDNRRLRAIVNEERDHHASELDRQRRLHAEDRAEWLADKAAMRAEIDALEAKLRAVLSEVEAFKRRHHREDVP
jgi:hypothetical protein